MYVRDSATAALVATLSYDLAGKLAGMLARWAGKLERSKQLTRARCGKRSHGLAGSRPPSRKQVVRIDSGCGLQ